MWASRPTEPLTQYSASLAMVLELGLSKRYKLYSFKHTGGVKLVNAGVNTWEIQKHFRHKSITTTERYLQKRFGVKSSLIQEDFPDM